jgi:hypothetical protein
MNVITGSFIDNGGESTAGVPRVGPSGKGGITGWERVTYVIIGLSKSEADSLGHLGTVLFQWGKMLFSSFNILNTTF